MYFQKKTRMAHSTKAIRILQFTSRAYIGHLLECQCQANINCHKGQYDGAIYRHPL